MPSCDLLPLQAVAKQLSISLSLVQRLARAAEMAAEVRSGRRKRDDVPPSIAPYLDSGFPVPRRIGRSVRRVRADELAEWLS